MGRKLAFYIGVSFFCTIFFIQILYNLRIGLNQPVVFDEILQVINICNNKSKVLEKSLVKVSRKPKPYSESNLYPSSYINYSTVLKSLQITVHEMHYVYSFNM